MAAGMRNRCFRAFASTLALSLAVVSLAACGSDDDDAAGDRSFVALDGSPRIADAEGVLLEVASDFSTLRLDGDRTYDIDEGLQSFAAADGSVQPVGRYVGNYVQVGLNGAGDTVQWLGSIASTVELPDEPLQAFLTGVIVDGDDGKLTFRSGTVLTLGDDVEVPDLPAAVVATIDVAQRAVVALAPG